MILCLQPFKILNYLKILILSRLQKLNQILIEGKDKAEALSSHLEIENVKLQQILDKIFHKLNIRESQHTKF